MGVAQATERELQLSDQIAAALSLASLASSRAIRANKILEAGDTVGLKDELGAITDLIQDIIKQLA